MKFQKTNCTVHDKYFDGVLMEFIITKENTKNVNLKMK